MGQDKDFAAESYYRARWRRIRNRIQREWEYRNEYAIIYAYTVGLIAAGYLLGWRKGRRRDRI